MENSKVLKANTQIRKSVTKIASITNTTAYTAMTPTSAVAREATMAMGQAFRP